MRNLLTQHIAEFEQFDNAGTPDTQHIEGRRVKSKKTFEKPKDVLHEIEIRAAKIKDAKISNDTGNAVALLDKLASDIGMEDKEADPNTIRVVC